MNNTYNKDTPLIKCKWLEIYFGLFGPCLTYHTSGYDDDNARLVISLIFCQLYIVLPWKHATKHDYDLYATYGFYSACEPDRLIFQWGNIYKMMVMPWVRVIVKRNLLDMHNDIVELQDYSYEAIMNELNEVRCNYVRSTTGYGYECEYFVVRQITRPKLFQKVAWFDKISYEVNTTFNKAFYGSNGLSFTTNTNIAIPEQIELQMMMKDSTYKDF